MTPADILRLALQQGLQRHVSEVSDPAEQERAKAIETTYTLMVEALRHCPSASIRALADDLWRVVGDQHCRTAVFDAVGSIHFTIVGDGGRDCPMLLIPPTWLDAVQSDPIFCLGGVVFTGSQAVSWHKLGRIDPILVNRAHAYEAEYLLTVDNPAYRFSEYQRQILAQYPRGLASFEG